MESITKEIAFHEAGHAVLLRHFGISIVRINIYRADGNMPAGGGTERDPRHPRLSDKDEALICVAGFAAEDKYISENGGTPKSWADFQEDKRYYSDRKCARNAIAPSLPSELSEDDDGEAEDELVRCELAGAKHLVAKSAHWHAISVLADKLYESHEVDGKAAMEIIDAYLVAG